MLAVGKKERQIPMRIRKLRKSGKKERKKAYVNVGGEERIGKKKTKSPTKEEKRMIGRKKDEERPYERRKKDDT